jgi:hypothetical protein
MNKNSLSIKKLTTYACVAALGLGFLGTLQSCKETIDSSNFAISKEETITDHLRNNAEYSQIYKILQRVKLGNKETASALSSVLSARGNYTIFAPNDSAVNLYLKQVLGEGKTVDDLNDEQAERIAYSCIIDNGFESAYDSPQFVDGALPKGDLNNRNIVTKQLTDSTKKPVDTYYAVNGKSRIVKADFKLSNGYLHEVNAVIAPSDKLLPDLMAEAGNLKVMSGLLTATGWDKKLLARIDKAYEDKEHDTEERGYPRVQGKVLEAAHRYFGFTGFVETDDVFAKEWGVPAPVMAADGKTVTNMDAIIASIRSKCEAAYGNAATGDLTNEENAINKFVAYHFLMGNLGYNKFVSHFNEWGYKYGDKSNPQTNKYSIDLSDYFTTVGEHPEILKITQVASDKKIYINRVATYDPTDYTKTLKVGREGVLVSAENVVNGKTIDNNAGNGFYFPIDKVLLFDTESRNALGGERIRFDITTCLPELLSYGCRSARKHTSFSRDYFKNITKVSESTIFLYLHAGSKGTGNGWSDYEGDEFMAQGIYDFVLKLPPVPIDGTYEIRMGCSNNEVRGMCQVYFGDNPNNLQPVGLPLDMRQKGEGNDNIGWVKDSKDDAVTAEIDKNMRNLEWMKAPRSFTVIDGNGEKNLRNENEGRVLRRIITLGHMKKGKTYYLRFKSALNQSDVQFFSDYFEYVPRSVFNGTEPEDQW